MPFITQGKTNWLFIVIFAVIAVAICGGVLFYINQINKETTSLSNIPEMKIPETVVNSGTAELQAYINNQYGIEFKYPQSWNLDTNFDYFGRGGFINIYPLGSASIQGLSSIEIKKIQKTLSLSDLPQQFSSDGQSHPKVSGQETTTVAGMPAIKFNANYDYFTWQTTCLINGIYYYCFSPSDNAYFEEIFPTFKFFEPIAKSFKNEQKIYQNDEYGFELTYFLENTEISESSDNIRFLLPSGSTIDVNINKTDLPESCVFTSTSSEEKNMLSFVGTKDINGINFYYYKNYPSNIGGYCTMGGCVYEDIYRAFHNGECYELKYWREVESIPAIINQIISTFKFIPTSTSQ